MESLIIYHLNYQDLLIFKFKLGMYKVAYFTKKSSDNEIQNFSAAPPTSNNENFDPLRK